LPWVPRNMDRISLCPIYRIARAANVARNQGRIAMTQYNRPHSMSLTLLLDGRRGSIAGQCLKANWRWVFRTYSITLRTDCIDRYQEPCRPTAPCWRVNERFTQCSRIDRTLSSSQHRHLFCAQISCIDIRETFLQFLSSERCCATGDRSAAKASSTSRLSIHPSASRRRTCVWSACFRQMLRRDSIMSVPCSA